MPHVRTNRPKFLSYLQWPPSKSDFISKFLLMERVTIAVGYFPNTEFLLTIYIRYSEGNGRNSVEQCR